MVTTKNHWTITESNSLSEVQPSEPDESSEPGRVEVCEGFENRQEFNGVLTKRIPITDELCAEINKAGESQIIETSEDKSPEPIRHLGL